LEFFQIGGKFEVLLQVEHEAEID